MQATIRGEGGGGGGCLNYDELSISFLMISCQMIPDPFQLFKFGDAGITQSA